MTGPHFTQDDIKAVQAEGERAREWRAAQPAADAREAAGVWLARTGQSGDEFLPRLNSLAALIEQRERAAVAEAVAGERAATIIGDWLTAESEAALVGVSRDELGRLMKVLLARFRQVAHEYERRLAAAIKEQPL